MSGGTGYARRKPTRVGRAYLDLIAVTLKDPPVLTPAEKARRLADLAAPRVDPRCVQPDLFRGRR